MKSFLTNELEGVSVEDCEDEAVYLHDGFQAESLQELKVLFDWKAAAKDLTGNDFTETDRAIVYSLLRG